MLIEWSKTERGFRIGAFRDLNGEACSVQESSLATEPAIWLGADEPRAMALVVNKGWQPVRLPDGSRIMPSRMHLTREQVCALLPVLAHFAKTGEVHP